MGWVKISQGLFGLWEYIYVYLSISVCVRACIFAFLFVWFAIKYRKRKSFFYYDGRVKDHEKRKCFC